MVDSPIPSQQLGPARTDADTLAGKVLAILSAGPDGIEPGFTTTEFWLSALALVGDFTGPHFGYSLTPGEQAIGAGLIVAAYNLCRAYRKRGATAPAKP